MSDLDPTERDAAARAILDELAPPALSELAGRAWSRLLVQTQSDGDEPIAVAIDVEGVTDDEAVDRAFAPESLGPLLPVLGRAVEALILLRGGEPEAFGGGTFLWAAEGRLAFLPGLVRTPSARLEAERDRVTAAAWARNAALRERYRLDAPGASVRFDARSHEVVVTRPDGEERRAGVLVATWEPASWVFGWLGQSPEAPPELRRRAAELVDRVLLREPWELSTPAFQTDAETAFAVVALVADHAGADGVLAIDERRDGVDVRGFVVVLAP